MYLVSVLSIITSFLLYPSDASYYATRESFNIQVKHKSTGDSHSQPLSVKAHKFEALIEFLGLDNTDYTGIVNELSIIPHNITVDVSASMITSSYTDENLSEILSSSTCARYAPTYLFSFDRKDIKDEFGNGYFLLLPSDELIKGEIIQTDSIPIENSWTGNHKKLWLHIQKTGTSFESTTRNLGYEDNNHDPCHIGDECEMITLLRDPIERLISWFYYVPEQISKCELKKYKNASPEDYKQNLQKCFNEFLKEDMIESKPIYWGCESKMLVGYHCDDDHRNMPPSLRSDVGLTQAALKKINDEKLFKFVGNTDFFEASVTLSHQMLGGELDLFEDLKKVNSREVNEQDRPVSGNKNLDLIHYHSNFLCENNELCSNIPDQMLFKEVQKIMMKNILKNHNKFIRIKGENQPPHLRGSSKMTKIPFENCPQVPVITEKLYTF